MNLHEITGYLDNLLKIKEIEDKSLNGLVVENSGDNNRSVGSCGYFR